MGLARAVARLSGLGCLGLLLAALAGCGLAGGMMKDIDDLRGASGREPDHEAALAAGPGQWLDPADIPVPGRDIEPGGFFTNNGTVLDADAVGAWAAACRYVLLGEGHTAPCDHLAQEGVIRAMARAGAPPVLGLEMVAVDNRSPLHGFNLGSVRPADLERLLNWERTWGHAFSLYRGVFEAAAELRLPLEALNEPQDVVRAVSEGGLACLTPEQSAVLPEPVIPASAAQRASLEEEFRRHRDMGSGNATMDDGQALERFLFIQSLWDTKMADEAVHAWRRFGRPVAVLAGAGHVEYGWGIGLRLAALDPGAPVLTVMPWRGGPVDRAAADIFFYCPMRPAGRLGLTLEMGPDGALVLAVEPGSRAEAGGLEPGDVIVEAQGGPVADLMALHAAAVRAGSEGDDLVLAVRRAGGRVQVRIPLAKGEPEAPGAGTP